MSTIDNSSGYIMDLSASLNNDSAKERYTYVAQLPYLNMALIEMQEFFQLNSAPVTDVTSAELELAAGTIVVGFDTPVVQLPSNLVEIQQVWERGPGDGQSWIPMTKVNFLPHYLDGALVQNFLVWAWLSNEIHVQASSQDNELKLDYIRNLFDEVTDENTNIPVINCTSFLSYRTASLCAEFIGEDKPRADSLKGNALIALDRTLGINAKGQQSITIRRRPFRASYKSRNSGAF